MSRLVTMSATVLLLWFANGLSPSAAWLTTTNTRIITTTAMRSASDDSSNNNDDKDNTSPSKFPRLADGTYSARYLQDNGLVMMRDEDGFVTARPTVYEKVSKAELMQQPSVIQQNNNDKQTTATANTQQHSKASASSVPLQENPATVVPVTGFNVVLTHATADFDSLAAAVGLARLWTEQKLQSTATDETIDAKKHRDGSDEDASDVDDASHVNDNNNTTNKFSSASHVPTFVVLPRGAHPGVQRFLALHKHLFPIRSLKSLPDDLSGLNRLALVDAQRRDRLGPADALLQFAKRVTVVDHHVDQESDIPSITDYIVDQVGSVSTLLTEYLRDADVALTEAEATLLALGIHADTGSLVFDSTTPRDAAALAWCLAQGASQAAIAEHAHPFLSQEQQDVLTQALVNVNTTVVHGVTISTVLLTADGFINGLAAVAQDAMELSSSDVFLLGLVYEAQSGGRRKKSSKQRKQQQKDGATAGGTGGQPLLTSRLLAHEDHHHDHPNSDNHPNVVMTTAPDETKRRHRLQQAFESKDVDRSGTLDLREVTAALQASGVIAAPESIQALFDAIDKNQDGQIDLDEFIQFATQAQEQQQQSASTNNNSNSTHASANQHKSTTLILIGRAKAGSNLKNVKLNALLERYGGGGHSKAASATVRLSHPETEASDILQGLVDEIVSKGLQAQLTVGDFMTAPVLSVQVDMTERQVEDLFTRYDVRSLPVVDDKNDVIGLVTYKEVASAKQRLWNKEQKRLRREQEAAKKGEVLPDIPPERQKGTNVKAWMLQHIQTVEASKTMAEVELILLENDVGCIPVVADGTNQLVGMVTRTDLLRQHRYYNTLHYHNKGFANSIANRKNIIELRKRLKRFDDE